MIDFIQSCFTTPYAQMTAAQGIVVWAMIGIPIYGITVWACNVWSKR